MKHPNVRFIGDSKWVWRGSKSFQQWDLGIGHITKKPIYPGVLTTLDEPKF